MCLDGVFINFEDKYQTIRGGGEKQKSELLEYLELLLTIVVIVTDLNFCQSYFVCKFSTLPS